MSLIKCNECEKEISDKSDKCIHCGAPIDRVKEKVKNKVIHLIPLLISVFVFGVIIYLYVVKSIDAYSSNVYIVLNYSLLVIDVIALISIFYIIPKERKILFPLSIVACIFVFLTMIGTGFGGW